MAFSLAIVACVLRTAVVKGVRERREGGRDMQRAQKGSCATSRPHWHLSVALPRVEIFLAEERQGAANNPRKGARGLLDP